MIALVMVFLVGCSTSSKKAAKDVKPATGKKEVYKMGVPLAETVDVFPGPEPRQVQGAIQQELDTYEKAKKFFRQKQYDKASLELKKIDQSLIRQIRVHARFLAGEIMFESGEYDLAMQIYEEILKNNAFSGLVIKSLERLIVCSAKLKLEEKRQRYHSLLHDTFES